MPMEPIDPISRIRSLAHALGSKRGKVRRKFTIFARQPVIRLMCTGLFGALPITCVARARTLAADSIENLQRLSIEQLANLHATPVSKVPESPHDALRQSF